MSVFPQIPHNRHYHLRQILSHAIDRHDEPIVGTRGLDDVVERFFGGDVLSLLQDDTGDNFGVRESGFPTFGMFSFVEFQCSKES